MGTIGGKVIQGVILLGMIFTENVEAQELSFRGIAQRTDAASASAWGQQRPGREDGRGRPAGVSEKGSMERASITSSMKFVETDQDVEVKVKRVSRWQALWNRILGRAESSPEIIGRLPYKFVDTDRFIENPTDLSKEKNFQTYRYKFVNNPDHLEFLEQKYEPNPNIKQWMREIDSLRRLEIPRGELGAELFQSVLRNLPIQKSMADTFVRGLLHPATQKVPALEVFLSFFAIYAQEIAEQERARLESWGASRKVPLAEMMAEAVERGIQVETQSKAAVSQPEKFHFVSHGQPSAELTDFTEEKNFHRYRFGFVNTGRSDRSDYIVHRYGLQPQEAEFFDRVREIRHLEADFKDKKRQMKRLLTSGLGMESRPADILAKKVLSESNRDLNSVEIFQKFHQTAIRSAERIVDLKIERSIHSAYKAGQIGVVDPRARARASAKK